MNALGRSVSLLLLAAGALLLPSCGDDDIECQNGTCVCDHGDRCNIVCEAPPCHAICAGDNPDCYAECANGDCSCGRDSHCDFGCLSPPCHVACGPKSECAGVCANGTCSCAIGARCDFLCKAGPCHVECEGNNPSCGGECANGDCTCGKGSSCVFECTDVNCHIHCLEGASCLLDCSKSASSCGFETCAAGEPVLCPDGTTIACGRACP